VEALVDRIRLPRRRLGPTAAFVLVAAIIGLALFASATPTPLYGDYQAEWHFSTLVLTLVYAVYAFGVLAALLLAGRISDDVGRRPVLAGALVGLIVAGALFTLADSVAWLFAARALQGLTTGAALGAAGAALLDLHPRRDGEHAGLINGVVSAAGIGTGAVVASVLAQYAPDPLVTPFIVLLALVALALAGTLAMPEPVEREAHPRLRPQRPRVPAAIRRPFVLSGLGVLSSWSIGGIYLALGPGLASELMDTPSHLAGGGAVLALCLPAALAQLRWHGLDARRAAAVGSGILALGMALTAGSLSAGSPALFLGASAVTGAGFGLAFLGALRSLTAVVPADHRAEVMSAFYQVAYLSLSVPAIAAGLAVPDLGLESTFRVFSLAVVLLAGAVTVAALRTARCVRPAYASS
jgi:predicted MFS family arabinose efflux permease